MAATQDDQIIQLTQRVRAADTVEALQGLIRELDAFQAAAPDAEKIDNLRDEAFERARRLTAGEPDVAQDVLIGELLPLCLRAEGAAIRGRAYRELLRDWLNDYSGAAQHKLRKAVISEVVVGLASAEPTHAIFTASEIEYRDEKVTAALRSIVAACDDERGDHALRAIIRLGVPPAERDGVLTELHRRATVRWTPTLIASLQELPDRSSLDLVLGRVGSGSDAHGSGAVMVLEDLTLQVIAAIAQRDPDDADLQDAIWRRVAALRSEPEGPIERVLRRNGRLAEGVDSPDVVPTYFDLLGPEIGARYGIIYDRLEALAKPRQLLGWDCGRDLNDRHLAVVRDDACAGSAMVGSWSTHEQRQKFLAWETLLSLAREETQELLAPAAASETNEYVLGELFELAACLEVATLPPDVSELIAARSTRVSDEGSHRLIAQIGAIGVAHSARTRAAFETLLGYEVIGSGGVLLSLVEALADCAAARIVAGDHDIEQSLWEAVKRHESESRRTAAIAALARLYRRRVVRSPRVGDLLAAIRDETLKSYERRELIDALGHLDLIPPDPEIVSVLKAIASDWTQPVRSTADDSGWPDLPPVALGALARLGVLASDRDLLEGTLGLARGESGWDVPAEPDRARRASFVIGFLYATAPDAFAPAAATIIDSGDWAALARLKPHLASGPVPTSSIVVDALVRRIRRVQTERTAEPELFALLARLDPDRLASEPWGGWEDWPPQARAAFGDAVRDAVAPGHERLRLLLPLMGDGQYGVRRTAYRAASDDPHSFADVCRSWAMATEGWEAVELRERAAEAVGWLPFPDRTDEVEALATDPEPTVRRAFARCELERRERLWANRYTDCVVTVRDGGEILKAWKYGRALGRVGDDVTLKLLELRRGDADLPPAVRRWLSRIIKQVRKRWDDATRRWPGPWFARRGRLEAVDAAITYEDGRKEPFRGWLWQVVSDDPIGVGSWGGWAIGTFHGVGRSTLTIDGKVEAEVIVTLAAASPGITYFTGSGPYPDPRRDPQTGRGAR